MLGSGWHTVYGVLDDIPVYAKAGAIIPMDPKVGWGEIGNPATLQLLIFPGADNFFELYEDDGETNTYLEGKFALTKFTQSWGGDSLTFTISPTTGDLTFVPGKRSCILTFRGIANPENIFVNLNGSPFKVESSYQTTTETLELTPIKLAPTDELSVTLQGNLLATRARDNEKLEKYLFQFKLESWEKKQIYQDWARIAAGKLSLKRYRHLTDAQRSVLESLLAKEVRPERFSKGN